METNIATESQITECVYCSAHVPNEGEVPSKGDDAAWRMLALQHAADCEWISTRAHRIEPA